jgi:hypothetical protein
VGWIPAVAAAGVHDSTQVCLPMRHSFLRRATGARAVLGLMNACAANRPLFPFRERSSNSLVLSSAQCYQRLINSLLRAAIGGRVDPLARRERPSDGGS